MKKNIFYFVLLAGIAVSFSSCISTLIASGIVRAAATAKKDALAVDESVPEDQTVIITFENDQSDGWFKVKEWSNERSSKEIDVGSWGSPQFAVPAGNNSFTFDVTYSFRSGMNAFTEYPFRNIQLRYDLELGKEYLIKGITKTLGVGKGDEIFVGIFEVIGKQELLLKQWKLGENH
jgi:hypothetical protein